MSMAKETTKCKVLVLCCIDFRYAEATLRFVKKRFHVTKLDLKTDAGGVKVLLDEKPQVRNWVLNNLKLARAAHGIGTVVLVNHQDCAACGRSETFKNAKAEKHHHVKELKKATRVVRKVLPDTKVLAFYAHHQQKRTIFSPVI